MEQRKRTFLITGATKGIGYATAIRLHQQGHHVIGVARHKAEFPGDLYQADLADEDATVKVFNTIDSKYKIDGIVNNAGIVLPQALEAINLNDFRSVLDVNLRPALQAMQLFMQGMVERKWGRVVNIASRAILGRRNLSSYSTAKAGLVALTRTWALELARSGITVNAVAPGPIATDSFYQNNPKNSTKEKETLERLPMYRLGQPEEVAFAIIFFLSEDASFVTGQTMYVDGGGSIGSALV